MTGRPEKYPWQEWFSEASRNGSKMLIAGNHYAPHIKPSSMRTQIYAAGRRHGFRVGAEIRMDMEPVAIRLSATRIDVTRYLDGELHQLNPSDLGMSAYELIELVKVEASRRGIPVLANSNDTGEVAVKATIPPAS